MSSHYSLGAGIPLPGLRSRLHGRGHGMAHWMVERLLRCLRCHVTRWKPAFWDAEACQPQQGAMLWNLLQSCWEGPHQKHSTAKPPEEVPRKAAGCHVPQEQGGGGASMLRHLGTGSSSCRKKRNAVLLWCHSSILYWQSLPRHVLTKEKYSHDHLLDHRAGKEEWIWS